MLKLTSNFSVFIWKYIIFDISFLISWKILIPLFYSYTNLTTQIDQAWRFFDDELCLKLKNDLVSKFDEPTSSYTDGQDSRVGL